MNLSKELKKKRDAEARLNKQSPQPTFTSDGTTDAYIGISGLATKSELTAGLADKSDIDHVHEITELTDVSITYSTNAGKFLKVNSTEDGIDLGEASGGGASDFLDLADTPSAYTGEGGKIVAVKSTADGLEFVSAPAAANGIPTGGTENQLMAKNSSTDYDVKWVDAPAAANGLPSGGTAGQMLSKIDGTDYNTEWVDPPSGGGIEVLILFGGNASASGRTETGMGLKFLATSDLIAVGGTFYTVWSNGVVFTAKLWDTSNNVIASGTITGDGSTGWKDIDFSVPYNLSKFTEYHISVEMPSGTLAKYYTTGGYATVFAVKTETYSGLPTGKTSSTDPYSIGLRVEL